MAINRRDFLKVAASGGAVAVAGATEAQAMREPMSLPPKAIGMLYDSTLCIGCKACVVACREANGLDPVDEVGAAWNGGLWDAPKDLSARTFNVIQAYQHGAMAEKDREKDGFAFVKRHCLHCVDPSCVSACPVKAMLKDPMTGVVTYDPDACIGCRYCVYSCPFNIPRFDYDVSYGQIGKCEFCSHLLADGMTPACCHVCPTGASLFGLVVDLQAEAAKRLAAKPGDVYLFPRGNLSGGRAFADKGEGRGEGQQLRRRAGLAEGEEGKGRRMRRDRPEGGRREGAMENNHGANQTAHEGRIGRYLPQTYGEKELGGTQVRYLSGVGFDKLGLPTNVPDHAYASVSEGIQGTLYKGMIGPLALLGGLVALAWRNTRGKEDEGGEGK